MTARPSILLLTFVVILVLCSPAVGLQARDYLTAEEIELVKEAQILDKRIDVFIKAANRRVLALSGTDATMVKQLKKDSASWGELPSGSRAELIGDIAGIFNAAIDNIDDVSAHDENNPLIPKALRTLAAAASQIVEQLSPAEAQAKEVAELNSFDQVKEYAESILQAANKLPPPVEKKGKSKTEKPKATN